MFAFTRDIPMLFRETGAFADLIIPFTTFTENERNLRARGEWPTAVMRRPAAYGPHRCNFVLGSTFTVDSYERRATYWNLAADTSETIVLKGGLRKPVVYDVDPGMLWLIGNSFYVNRWCADDNCEKCDDLQVIRDAVQLGALNKAHQLGRESWPHSYKLFIDLCQREMKFLARRAHP